jgi:ribosomal protein S18 acetylase RimI-like enzyme
VSCWSALYDVVPGARFEQQSDLILVECPRTQAAARALGLTHEERVPGMVALPEELVEVAVDLDIGPIVEAEIEESAELLSIAFGAPKDLFSRFATAFLALPEVTWYVGREDGAVASTAVAFAADDAVGIFDVATPPEHRRRGYGAAMTARAARDGFAAGSDFAFLRSSELGYGVYRRLGFRDVEEYVLLTRPPTS